VMGKDKSRPLGDGFMSKFEPAMEEATAPEFISPSSSPPTRQQMPILSAKSRSPRRGYLLRALCRAYVHVENPRAGERWCGELLAMEGSGEDVDGLVGKGEAALKREEWEEGVRFLEKAFEGSGRASQQIHERLQRARRLLKQSKQKDYYKVLDVARDADARTIKKAFRRAAMKAHPDKGGSESKMATVNEAYEVLSKPELRARFDAGEDPNDPMAQQHHYQHGFQFQGEHPFSQFFQQGSGGFQFHFNHRP